MGKQKKAKARKPATGKTQAARLTLGAAVPPADANDAKIAAHVNALAVSPDGRILLIGANRTINSTRSVRRNLSFMKRGVPAEQFVAAEAG